MGKGKNVTLIGTCL